MSESITSISSNRSESKRRSLADLYSNRKLAQGYPGMDRLALEHFSATLELQPDETVRIDSLLARLNRLIDLPQRSNVAVIGCGPKPQTMRLLAQRNYEVVGVEPVPLFVHAAREYLKSEAVVEEGFAENIPLPDGSQRLVLCDSVLEHVVSPGRSLAEMHRVLAPGGIAFISTTNRLRFSISGRNGEYVYRYFNWLPRLVKECLVFQHLHYKPTLANYSQFPAVHWFTYSHLCTLGREAGFAQFYSVIDLVDEQDATLRRSPIKRLLARKLKYNPWLRALALTQRGESIVMLKK